MDYSSLKIPNHLGIILDGNGRWAKNRGLSRSKGHEAGFKNLKKLSKTILNSGVKILSVYAFSTENFKRSKDEVDYLMNIFANQFKKELPFFKSENIKVIFSGKRAYPLPDKVIDTINEMEEQTKNNTNGILNICINYGGHAEIIDAIKKLYQDNVDIASLDEELFSHYLYQDLPPIDLLIRTSGEQRISNFMLWQLSYAEFYFPKVHFPDFDEEEYYKALVEYSKRDRRFGGIKED